MFKLKEAFSLSRLKKDGKILGIAIIISLFFTVVFVSTETEVSQNTSSFTEESTLSMINWFMIFFKAAIIEETIFRVIPFIIAIILIKIISLVLNNYRKKTYMIITLFFGVFSSLIFGMMHGNSNNILIQGVMGFSFWLILIQNYKITNSVITSGLKSVLFHVIYNVILFLPVLLLT